VRLRNSVVLASACAGALSGLAACDRAPAGDLYDDFARICVAHIEDEKGLIDAAVKDGWRETKDNYAPHRLENERQVSMHAFVKETSKGRRTLHIGQTAYIWQRPHPQSLANSCAIVGPTDRGSERARAWADVPSDKVKGVPDGRLYSFAASGGKHWPLPNDRFDLFLTTAGGRMLMVGDNPNGVSVLDLEGSVH
jgi:hypothetical protein